MTEKRKYTCRQKKILSILLIVAQLLVNTLIIKVSAVNVVIYTIVLAIIFLITTYFDCKKEKNKENS